MNEPVSNPNKLPVTAGSECSAGLGDWFECLGAPGRDGKYLSRMDEDEDESEYKVYYVRNRRISTEDGRERLVWNVQWKRIA